jgi:hypothetical protein
MPPPHEGAYWTQQAYFPIGPNHGVPDAKTQVQFIDDKQWKRDGDLPAKVNFIIIDFSPWGSAPLRMWFDAFGIR